jgi:hypothetical protein
MTNLTSVLKRMIPKWVGITPGYSELNESERFGHFVTSLKTRWKRLKKTDSDIQADSVLQSVQQFMKAYDKKQSDWPKDEWDEQWLNAMQAERFMARYLGSTELMVDAEKWLYAADQLSLPTAIYFTAKWDETKAIKDNAARKEMQNVLYDNILERQHWYYVKGRKVRKIRSLLAGEVIGIAVFLTLIAVLPAIILACIGCLGVWPSTAAADSPWSHLYGLYAAATFGLLGALFSRMTYMQSRYSTPEFYDLTNNFTTKALWIRLLIGMIGGLLVFYGILAGLLGMLVNPALLPNPSNLQSVSPMNIDSNFFRLIVWSFIGGYSERLVPNFLARAEASSKETD